MGSLCSFLSSCTWAIGVSTYSTLSRRYPGTSINFNRALVALPLFFLLTLLQGNIHELSRIQWHQISWFATGILTSYALGDTLFLISTHTLGVPGALAIASTYPLWSAVAGWIFRGERLSFLAVTGLMLAVGGVVSVILGARGGGKSSEMHTGKAHWKGALLALLASFLWATNTYASAQGSGGMPSSVANIVRMGMALFICPVIGRLVFHHQLKKGQLLPMLSFSDFKKTFVIFMIEGFGGSFTYMYGLAHAPLAVAASLSSLAPVISVSAAWMRKTEELNFLKTAGVLAAVAGSSLLVIFRN